MRAAYIVFSADMAALGFGRLGGGAEKSAGELQNRESTSKTQKNTKKNEKWRH
jgi:hypothetical protein